MGNCFKCLEKQEDEDQLINDDGGQCFLGRKWPKIRSYPIIALFGYFTLEAIDYLSENFQTWIHFTKRVNILMDPFPHLKETRPISGCKVHLYSSIRLIYQADVSFFPEYQILHLFLAEIEDKLQEYNDGLCDRIMGGIYVKEKTFQKRGAGAGDGPRRHGSEIVFIQSKIKT